MIGVLERYLPRINRLGDDPRAVLIRHHYVTALAWSARYREAAVVQHQTSPMADRLGDSKSKAYSLAAELHISTFIAPKLLHEFETLKRETIKAASDTADAHIQNWSRWVIGLEEVHRGRMTAARDTAHELIQVGRLLGDPRSTGFGLGLLAWIAQLSDSYVEALEYSEQSLAVAVTRSDHITANASKAAALVLLRQTDEGAKLLEEECRRAVADSDIFSLAVDEGFMALCRVLQGNIGEGIHLLEEGILKREREGYRTNADWYRAFLSEVYLQIIAGNERLPFATLLKNLPILLKVIATASSRIPALMTRVLENAQFDPEGHHVGRMQMILGLLYKAKKKRALARQHLIDAKRIFSQFGQTPILARVETALAELGQ
jgi:hypothetical protein